MALTNITSRQDKTNHNQLVIISHVVQLFIMGGSTGGKKRKIGVDEASRKRPKINDVAASVFVYMGKGQIVPKDVVSVRFHPSVVAVEKDTFNNCYRLKEVVLNDGLVEIGRKAFRGCISLESITFPSTITNIGDYAFTGCSKLRKVDLNEGLERIGNHMFYFCDSLESVNFPSTLIEIGFRAFKDCGLRKVVLNNGLKKMGIESFSRCKSLETIQLPSTLIETGQESFKDCATLREVVLNKGIQKIGYGSFWGCESLESITIPSTVTRISNHACFGCLKLREAMLHDGLLKIGDYSFANCQTLERFSFPSLSARLDDVIQAGQRDIEAKVDDIPAVEWRGGELAIPIVRREIESSFGRPRIIVEVDTEKLDKIVKLVSYYEIKEATALFELALWKAKIGQKLDRVDATNPAMREACRIEVPGPVKDAILKFL